MNKKLVAAQAEILKLVEEAIAKPTALVDACEFVETVGSDLEGTLAALQDDLAREAGET